MQQIRDRSFVPAIISGALSQAVTLFGWTCLDGIEVPFVQRDGQKFFPVRIAEQKFLSQFTNVVKYDVQNPLLSYYMHAPEAFALTNSGCGEIFAVQDLLVNLEEFARFYEEVKEKCSKDCSKKAGVDGGWVQINNTIVPYVVKEDSVMISLAVVRCAAGLLVGRDVPVVYPDEDECRFLNDSCKSAGIAFDFTTSTELVELVLVSCMCNERPFIRQLPSGNPFAVAQPLVEDRSNTVSTIDGVIGAQPIHVLPEKALFESPPPYAGLACNQPPWQANSSHSTDIQVVNTHSLLQYVSDSRPVPAAVLVSSESSHLQFLAVEAAVGRTGYLQSGSVDSENQPPYQNPVVTSALGGSNSSKQVLKDQWKHSGVLQEYANNENALPIVAQLRQLVTDVGKKNTQMIVSDASKAQSLEHDRTAMPNILKNDTLIGLLSNTDGTTGLHESATDEEKQMQIFKGAQVPLVIVPESSDRRAGDSLILRRIECYGKTITCMVKHDKLYILLEAMNRLYFPMRRLDTVIKAVVEGLRVPVATLTADEERDFMKFYKIPAEKLNSNKVISVDDFIGVYRSLQCMLDNSFFTSHSVEPKTTTVESPAAIREGLTNSSIPVPVGIPVKNVSNTKVRQSRITSTKPNDHPVGSSDRLRNVAQSPSLKRKRMEKKFVNEMPKMAAVCENASEDGSSQKQPKRCKMRVIGEVICIDD